MRVESYLVDGSVGSSLADSVAEFCAELALEQEALQRHATSDLLQLLDRFAEQIPREESTRGIEGIGFLASWLRRENLEASLRESIADPRLLDSFVETPRGTGRFLRAQPCGVACHWLAGNVPTLAFFSLVPSLLARNATLLKLASPAPAATLQLLDLLARVGGPLSGRELLRAVRAIYFDHRDAELNQQMSLGADCKVMWGGASAVAGITSLPRRAHCRELVFGPKYSIGVVGRGHDAARVATSLARDVAAFDQRACSSPQTVFVEGSLAEARVLAAQVGHQLDRLPAKTQLDEYTAGRIMEVRARYGMDAERDLFQGSRGNDWTVCLEPALGLPDAIQSRTLFLIPVTTWQVVVPLLSHGVQTIGAWFGDPAEALHFAEAATRRGVSRVVRFGLMNVYESPWDGRMPLNDLVRWVVCKP